MEDVACTCAYERMIESGANIDEEESTAENAATDDKTCGAMRHADNHQRDDPSDGKRSTDPMSNSVCNDLAESMLYGHISVILQRAGRIQ